MSILIIFVQLADTGVERLEYFNVGGVAGVVYSYSFFMKRPFRSSVGLSKYCRYNTRCCLLANVLLDTSVVPTNKTIPVVNIVAVLFCRFLQGNSLSSLPANVFDSLTSLQALYVWVATWLQRTGLS